MKIPNLKSSGKVLDNVAKEVSETSQRWMNNSGEIRIGHKSNFHVKSLLIAGKVEICLIEVSHAYVQLLRKLTRRRVGDVKEIEEDLNRMSVFDIQVVGRTMACWVMTMPFGAFYFVQHLDLVQIPMN
ncbi:9453_t:CDS:2 [Ambispora leptoticha]|uniref:9453_t:CDS:1 n=1 Tax=Ambispora leptoticha TaxID=144679 RepID=A0A9N9A3B2_9GLOM|nr:9453_t:CDS:2 [Ambispora leptoticha]